MKGWDTEELDGKGYWVLNPGVISVERFPKIVGFWCRNWLVFRGLCLNRRLRWCLCLLSDDIALLSGTRHCERSRPVSWKDSLDDSGDDSAVDLVGCVFLEEEETGVSWLYLTVLLLLLFLPLLLCFLRSRRQWKASELGSMPLFSSQSSLCAEGWLNKKQEGIHKFINGRRESRLDQMMLVGQVLLQWEVCIYFALPHSWRTSQRLVQSYLISHKKRSQ